MARRTIRISDQLDSRIRKAATERGFANPTLFLRASLEALVREKNGDDAGALEQRLAATLERIGRDLFRVQRAQQADRKSVV